MPDPITTPTAGHLLIYLTIGAMGTGAHFFIILAFSKAQASLLAPFNYSKLIWVTILGYLVFDDLPGVDTLIGSTIIAAAGLDVSPTLPLSSTTGSSDRAGSAAHGCQSLQEEPQFRGESGQQQHFG